MVHLETHLHLYVDLEEEIWVNVQLWNTFWVFGKQTIFQMSINVSVVW